MPITSSSNDSETFAIDQIATTTVVTCPASVELHRCGAHACTATVTSADGLNQSLTVTHTNNVNAGTATASAAYAGDANHNASNGSATFAINPLATATRGDLPRERRLHRCWRTRRARRS